MNPITGILGCCARATSGHAATPPTITLMKSRRLTAAPRLGNRHRTNPQQCFEWGSDSRFVDVRFTPEKRTCAVQEPMSALGQKRTFVQWQSYGSRPNSKLRGLVFSLGGCYLNFLLVDRSSLRLLLVGCCCFC